MNITEKLTSAIKTFLYFICFCFFVPFLLISYTCVSLLRSLSLFILSSWYSDLRLVKTNYVKCLSSNTRNSGFLHVLLSVEGICNADLIRTNLENHILNRKDKFGENYFKILKLSLTSCFGYYAWIQRNFNIDDHFHIYPSYFRDEAVTEKTIQDYVSNIILTCMPTNVPPWEIIVIPSEILENQSEKYYILLRIHHLILDEEPHLHIRDLLLINTGKSINQTKGVHNFSNSIYENQMWDIIYIPKLYSRITVGISNRWNEFIYRYDPLESPDYDKRQTTSLIRLLSIYLIMTVTVINDFYKGFNATKNTPQIKFKFLSNLIKREVRRRNIHWETLGDTLLYTINPMNIIKDFIGFIWSIWVTCTLMWPYFVYKELIAIRYCLFMGYCGYPDTFIGLLFEYTPLIYNAIREVLIILNIIITAPRYIWEEIFSNNTNKEQSFRKMSQFKRKSISWSSDINKIQLNQISVATGFSESEILLSMISMIKTNKQLISPESINISVTCLREDYILGQLNYAQSMEGFGCVSLPFDAELIDQIVKLRKSKEKGKNKQRALFLLISTVLKFNGLANILPSVFIKILFNYLSNKFTIAITEIFTSTTDLQYYTNWGQTVKNVIYFPPSQSNISLCLTLQKFGSTIKLGVMADEEIYPNYREISENWTKHIENYNHMEKVIHT